VEHLKNPKTFRDPNFLCLGLFVYIKKALAIWWPSPFKCALSLHCTALENTIHRNNPKNLLKSPDKEFAALCDSVRREGGLSGVKHKFFISLLTVSSKFSASDFHIQIIHFLVAAVPLIYLQVRLLYTYSITVKRFLYTHKYTVYAKSEYLSHSSLVIILYSTLLHLPRLGFQRMLGLNPCRTVATVALAVRRSKTTQLDLSSTFGQISFTIG
jgi:hypothetical protein